MVYTVKIIEKKEEIHDTFSFFLEKPTGFAYKAGQYGIFEQKIGEELIRRSYSFSSSPTEPFIKITVRHIPGGKMTSWLTTVSPGDTLTFNGPFGKFSLETQKEVVFIAGGSGVTPFRAMAKYAIDSKKDIEMVLIYGARSPRDFLFNEELNSFLVNKNFKLFQTIDVPFPGWGFHVGFINKETILEACCDGLKGKDFFLCGPPIMITAVKNALSDLGVPEQRINIDAWG